MARIKAAQENRNMRLILIAALLCVIADNSHAIVSQNYNLAFKLTPSLSQGLNIDLIEPIGAYYNATSLISMRYIVSYNTSSALYCNLSIDSYVVSSTAVTDATEKQVSLTLNLYQGHHTWKVACTDSLGNTRQSQSSPFTIDLEAPSIRLNNPNPDISLSSSINLSFTPVDNYASAMDCSIGIFRRDTGTVYALMGIAGVQSGRDKITALTGMDHGNYSWNVTCLDLAGNIGISDNRNFFIDLNRNFSIEPNKDLYSLGEGGVLVISAPFGSRVTMLLTNPNLATQTREYSGVFPVVDTISINNYSGTYRIDGFLNFNNAVKTISRSFTVSNNMYADIRSQDFTIGVDESIEMNAYSRGGLGEIAYKWDFGDSSTIETGDTVSHKYDEKGSYKVNMTATDAYGNSVTAEETVSVKDKYKAAIIVKDRRTNSTVQHARIYIYNKNLETDASGRAEITLFEGLYPFSVVADGYHSYFERNLDVYGETTEEVYLAEETSYPEVIGDVHEYDNPASQISMQDADNATYYVASSGGLDDWQDSNGVESAGDDTLGNEIENANYNLMEKTGQAADYKNLDRKVSNALAGLDMLDAESRPVSIILGMKESLEAADKTLKNVDRDMHVIEENRRNLTSEERQKAKQKIFDSLDMINNNTISNVRVISSDDYIRYPKADEIGAIAKEYLKFLNISLSKGKYDDLIRAYLELQKLISVSTKARSIEIEYLSGERRIFLLVTFDITSTDDLTGSAYVVLIPKELSDDSGKVKMITEGKPLGKNGLFSYDVSANRQVSLLIATDAQADKARQARQILAVTPGKIKSKGLGALSGFAVFSKITTVEDPIMLIEIIAIIVLVIVYLLYQFDVIERIHDGTLFKDRSLEKIRRCMKDAQACISVKEYGNAEVVYEDVIKEYKNLAPSKRAKVKDDSEDIYNKIILGKIDDSIDNALMMLKDGKFSDAAGVYENNVMSLYRTLQKEYKPDAKDRCALLYEKLSSASESASGEGGISHEQA